MTTLTTIKNILSNLGFCTWAEGASTEWHVFTIFNGVRMIDQTFLTLHVQGSVVQVITGVPIHGFHGSMAVLLADTSLTSKQTDDLVTAASGNLARNQVAFRSVIEACKAKGLEITYSGTRIADLKATI